MFLLINKETKVQTCFTAIKKDVINYVLILELLDGKKEKYQFRSEQKMNEKIKSIASQTYLELNLDIVKLSNITSSSKTDGHNTYNIVYLLDSGTKVIESFDRAKDRDIKYSSLLTLDVGGSSPSGGGTKDYRDLENKPTINGVELNGNLSAARLGIKTSEIVNDIGYVKKDTSDLTNYYVKDETYNREEIEEKLKKGSGIPVITGTYANPIIASNLSFGVYVISGIVQSNERNQDTENVKMSIYSVWQEEDRTLFWEEERGDMPQRYVIFNHDEGEKIETGESTNNFEQFVIDYVRNAEIDGGEIR